MTRAMKEEGLQSGVGTSSILLPSVPSPPPLPSSSAAASCRLQAALDCLLSLQGVVGLDPSQDGERRSKIVGGSDSRHASVREFSAPPSAPPRCTAGDKRAGLVQCAPVPGTGGGGLLGRSQVPLAFVPPPCEEPMLKDRLYCRHERLEEFCCDEANEGVETSGRRES